MAHVKFNDRIRLELDASDAPNKITNHSGQGGSTAGWTADSGYTLGVTASAPTRAAQPLVGAYTGGKTISITCTASVNDLSFVYSPSFAVVPGQFVGALASFADSVVPSGTVKLQVVAHLLYYSSGGTLINALNSVVYETMTEPDAAGWNMTVLQPQFNWDASYAVPVGAATAKVAFGFRYYNSSTYAVTKPAHTVYMSKMMVVMTTGTFTSQNVQFSDTATIYQTIHGKALDIKINRGGDIKGVTDEMSVGSLRATILDNGLDPVKNPTRVKPGKTVRLMALKADNVTWSPIFTGKLLETNVNYAVKEDQDREAEVTLTAIDAINDLNGIKSPFGYSGTSGQKIKALMASSTVPYVTDTGTASTTKITVEENATLWDQIQLVSNTYPTFKAWIDPTGTLQAKTITSTTPLYTFTDALTGGTQYLDINVTASSRDVVNYLTVKKADKTYGPYLNNASIIAHGPYQADVTVVDGSPSAIAQTYLNQFQSPTPIPNYVEIGYHEQTSNEMFLDLYNVVKIVNAQSTLSKDYYIISIEHHITPGDWTTVFTFRPLDFVGSNIAMSFPSAGADTGPTDVLDTSPSAGTYTEGNGIDITANVVSLNPNVYLTDEIGGSLFLSDIVLPGTYWLSFTVRTYTDQPTLAQGFDSSKPHYLYVSPSQGGTFAGNYLDGNNYQMLVRDSATSTAAWIRIVGDAGTSAWLPLGGAGSTPTASQIASTTVTGISATNVQAAIAELAQEKLNLPGLYSVTGTAVSTVVPTVSTLIPGVTLSVPVNGTNDVYQVTANIDITKTIATVAGPYQAFLFIGGTAQPANLIHYPSGTTLTTFRQTVSRTWYVTGITAGSKTFQVNHSGPASSYTVSGSPHTTLQVVKLAT